MQTSSGEILLDVADRVATITLNRPDRLNALTDTMLKALISAFDRTDRDDEVGAVIVTGSGRGFCAGADLGAGGSTFDRSSSASTTPPERVRDRGGLIALRIFDSLKPVIGAINGPAIGVGISMTLPMDIRLISSNAKVGFTFNRIGLVPEGASSWFLPRIVGMQKAAEWVYTGRMIRPDEAVDSGLVRSAHEPDELLGAASALAREIVDNTAPVSVALSRRLMWRMQTAAHPMVAHRADSRAVTARGGSADAREGIASLKEKRRPAFSHSLEDLPDVFPDWVEPRFEEAGQA